jgi:hypothetical protein
MRHVIEPGLPVDANGNPCSAGACLHAAVLLASIIENFGMCRARVRGGNSLDGFGAMAATGELRGHYWVEVALADGAMCTLDVTADHFGFEHVVILDQETAARRYLPGPQEEVDEAALALAAALGAGDAYARSMQRWETNMRSPHRSLRWQGT